MDLEVRGCRVTGGGQSGSALLSCLAGESEETLGIHQISI